MSWRGLAWPLAALVAVSTARRWLDVVEVRGRSMAPALLPGDRLLVARLGPRVGDVVLAVDPRDASRELVKRVAAIDRFGITLRGDNPAESTDARSFGSVSPDAVRWRAIVRYWPIDRAGRIPPPPTLDDLGGEPACAFPQDLVAG